MLDNQQKSKSVFCKHDGNEVKFCWAEDQHYEAMVVMPDGERVVGSYDHAPDAKLLYTTFKLNETGVESRGRIRGKVDYFNRSAAHMEVVNTTHIYTSVNYMYNYTELNFLDVTNAKLKMILFNSYSTFGQIIYSQTLHLVWIMGQLHTSHNVRFALMNLTSNTTLRETEILCPSSNGAS